MRHISKRYGLLLVFLMGCSSSPVQTPSENRNVSTRIEARQKDFRECFDETSIPDTISDVHMIVRFSIDSSGTVTHSQIARSVVKYPLLNDCVLGVIQSIHFDPALRESTDIDYPLVITRK